MKNKILLLFLLLTVLKGQAQCISDTLNIFSFEVNDIPYEIIKEKKSWVNAAACAVERGGKLAEINSRSEQDTVFYYLNQAGINTANTIAPDGGGASYVWLGGNDLSTEGKWNWDGANAGSLNQFWQGTSTGTAVGGSFTNWGNEPDNWNGQDGLGLAITNWPLGLAGQWNDVDETNQLYYVIEYPKKIAVSLLELRRAGISLYPNPAADQVTVKTPPALSRISYTLMNGLGMTVGTGYLQGTDNTIDTSTLPPGLYLLSIGDVTLRFAKQ